MLTDSPVKVLYIMGCGRSGSTVLDTVLGNHRMIVSVGELVKLPTSGWTNNEYCACGVRVDSCSFWEDVKSEWLRSTEASDPKEYIALSNSMNQLWKPFKTFESPDCSSIEFISFANYTLELFKAIKKVSGKTIIVDSSKNPLRAYVLSFIPGIELRLIHLIRDARGVAWSYKKAFKKNERAGVQRELKPIPVWRSAINWYRINLRCEWVRNHIDSKKSIRVMYEDFVKAPRKTLDIVGDLINEEFDSLSTEVESDRSLTVGHTIAGNRLRMKQSIKLTMDEEWKQKLNMFERSFVWAISGILMNRYKTKY